MILQEQVISIGQAKRLKELGVNAKSHFQWDGVLTDVKGKWVGIITDKVTATSIPAFTAAELGVMLPVLVYQNGNYILVATNK